jgi:dCMP deaminase
MNNKWDERFMQVARLIATWSKDPSTRCGCVIVDKHKNILATGFNGFARFTDDSPARYADRDSKLESVLHAEENAIINASTSLHGAKLYSTAMPCAGCVARIIQAGISSVIIPWREEDPFYYYRDRDWYMAQVDHGEEQFKQAGIYLGSLHPMFYDPSSLMGSQHPHWEKT